MRENLLSYLQILLHKELPFLLLKKANQSVVRIISQKDQKWHKTAPDNMTYAVLSKFEKSEDQVFIISEEYKEFKWNNSNLVTSKFTKTTDLINENEKLRYTHMVGKTVDMLKNSIVKKVVLSRVQTFPKSKTDLAILESLLDEYPSANCYFFYHPKIGKWMGATPEVLAAINGNKLQTMSLAGTAVFNPDHTHIWGEKEKEEQELVTNFIVENLQNVGGTDLHQSKVMTAQAGNLIHLKTEITASIDPYKKEDYIEALHPTPAVCGLPRSIAQEYIKEVEGYDRSFYTGYLGIVEENEASYYVNLRCMQLHQDEVNIYVGGGITAMSDPILEYEETVQKLLTMKKLL